MQHASMGKTITKAKLEMRAGGGRQTAKPFRGTPGEGEGTLALWGYTDATS
jgi:hypothetical protein